MSLLPINFRSLNQNFYNLRVHSEYLTHSSAGDNLFINCLDKLTWKKKMHTFTIRRIYGGNEEEFGSWNAHSLHASLANIKSSIAKLGKEMSDEQWKPVFITAIDRNINCTQLRTRENCCIASRDNWYCFWFFGSPSCDAAGTLLWEKLKLSFPSYASIEDIEIAAWH